MKLIEVIAESGAGDTLQAIARQHELTFVRLPVDVDNGSAAAPVQMFAADDEVQPVLDALQSVLGAYEDARIYVLPVDIALPKAAEEERRREDEAIEAREALYGAAEENAHLNGNYVVLLLLSTFAAAIGLVPSNVAVVIGAMVIAPLLGPNLALGLGTALGDLGLMRRSAITLSAGIVIAVVVSTLTGWLWPFTESSPELLMRTDVGLDSAVLALASGAAAALSITTGLSSVLVGVMVAVALLPPAAALGLMLGHGDWRLAGGAALLLAVNVVCLNLACKLVFLIKGVAPRTWSEQRAARQSMTIYVVVWLVTLGLLAGLIYLYHGMTP